MKATQRPQREQRTQRTAVPATLLLLLAACGGDALPPPKGSLRLQRDGILRVGRVEVADPEAVLRDRASQPVVAVEIDPETPFERVAKLFQRAVSVGVQAMDTTADRERVSILFGPRPLGAPVIPGGEGPRRKSVAVDAFRVTAIPERREVELRVVGAAASPSETQFQRLVEGIRECAAEMPAGSRVVVVLHAPASAPWGRLAALLACAAQALGARIVRHELAATS